MAFGTKLSNAAAIAACNAIVDLADVGGAGYVQIRDGSAPANVDDATTGTLLATLTLSNPAFGSAVDANPGGRATANAVTPDSAADASGTAGYFRVFNNAGTAIWQGLCGTSGADMILSTTTIVIGYPVNIISWTATMPES